MAVLKDTFSSPFSENPKSGSRQKQFQVRPLRPLSLGSSPWPAPAHPILATASPALQPPITRARSRPQPDSSIGPGRYRLTLFLLRLIGSPSVLPAPLTTFSAQCTVGLVVQRRRYRSDYCENCDSAWGSRAGAALLPHHLW